MRFVFRCLGGGSFFCDGPWLAFFWGGGGLWLFGADLSLSGRGFSVGGALAVDAEPLTANGRVRLCSKFSAAEKWQLWLYRESDACLLTNGLGWPASDVGRYRSHRETDGSWPDLDLPPMAGYRPGQIDGCLRGGWSLALGRVKLLFRLYPAQRRTQDLRATAIAGRSRFGRWH
jgi:hypothetical protein